MQTLINQVSYILARHYTGCECRRCTSCHFILDHKDTLIYDLTEEKIGANVGEDCKTIPLFNSPYTLSLEENGTICRSYTLYRSGADFPHICGSYLLVKTSPVAWCLMSYDDTAVPFINPDTNTLELPHFDMPALLYPGIAAQFYTGPQQHYAKRALDILAAYGPVRLNGHYRFHGTEWDIVSYRNEEEERYSVVPFEAHITQEMKEKFIFYFDMEADREACMSWNSPDIMYLRPHSAHHLWVLPYVHSRVPYAYYPSQREDCIVCGLKTTSSQHGFFIHNNCFSPKGYGNGNSTCRGKQVKLPAFSCEFEMQTPWDHEEEEYSQYEYGDNAETYEKLLLRFLQKGFVRTRDGTVSDEMNSPIYLSNKEFLPVLPVMDSAKRGGYITDDCGTHIHVGLAYRSKEVISENYRRLLGPLTRHVWSGRGECTPLIWGRDSNEHARITLSDLETRYLWINNDTGYETLEFRLPVFVSTKQYRMLIDFCRVFTRFLEQSMSAIRQDDTDTTFVGEKILAFYQRFEKFAIRHLENGK